uniref:Nudix hydrolase domain-containing protein n=1 Tax=Arion vulgaris TaxID=1028688 RepID=A0A0B7AR21_9EUPU
MASAIVFKSDRFGGVLVDMAEQTCTNLDDFFRHIKEAIVEWKNADKRGLWITVQTEQSSLIPKLTDLGFDFHHAKPGLVCLTKWLPENIPNHIPGYANHFLGVGGFVVNTLGQLLVIREQYHVKNNIATWKLPGGLADAGEEISETAIREVLEETGVETEFVCVIGYRHMHNYRHGCSDFYHVCLLKPLTTEIRPCPLEIAECKWMDLEEYEAADSIADVNKYIVRKYRDIISTGNFIGVDKVLSFDKKLLQNVYSVHAGSKLA